MAAGRRVYIIGFMGSGKSTTGKKLAAILGWQFLDLDKVIELAAGQSIKDIFSISGEDHFRILESSTLKDLIIEEDTVISTGGGTPCYGRNMDFMLETGIVIYLKMTPASLLSRLENSRAKRPLIANMTDSELISYITHKLSEREEYYQRSSIIIEGIDPDINLFKKMILERMER
jgi:shikimate kinase